MKAARRLPGKKTRGMTLVELLVTLALLMVVITAAGSAILSAFQSYSINRQLQEDEYNARLALLSMTREAHRGVSGVTVTEGANADTPDTLEIVTLDGKSIVFSIADGRLCREAPEGSTPVAFVEVDMLNFKAEFSEERWLTLRVTCQFGLELETKIALSRIPSAAAP